LAASDILSKNKLSDDKELSVALKRVEKLWDVQYQSAEGNDLHQLAYLICAYEKKDLNSYFEEAPLADDDFMPGRLNFKSKFTLDSDETASGILSNIYINENFDEANNQLLESIFHY
jgi:hypothetical protein